MYYILCSYIKISKKKENVTKIIKKRKYIHSTCLLKINPRISGPVQVTPAFFKGQLYLQVHSPESLGHASHEAGRQRPLGSCRPWGAGTVAGISGALTLPSFAL